MSVLDTQSLKQKKEKGNRKQTLWKQQNQQREELFLCLCVRVCVCLRV